MLTIGLSGLGDPIDLDLFGEALYSYWVIASSSTVRKKPVETKSRFFELSSVFGQPGRGFGSGQTVSTSTNHYRPPGGAGPLLMGAII